MDKINKIFKNLIIFLAIFLALNFILKSCQNETVETPNTNSTIELSTSNTNYSRLQTVTVDIKNNTASDLTIPNECPKEPLNILHYEIDNWVPKSVSPKLNCENAKDIIIKAGDEETITFENWNYALFSEMGRFRIELQTEINGELKNISSNEFTVVEEGIIKKLVYGIFFKPIYNLLVFLISVLPYHDLGLAIILLTLIIRTLLLIPNNKAMRSQQKLQDIQPRLQKIKDKYKGDQQKISMETMALWKEAKVNPLGSCFPMLLQFPFLIALFYVIKGGLNPDNAHLLYTTYSGFDIDTINVMFLGILDLTKPNIYVLPVVIGGLQFLQIKLSMFNKKKDKKDSKDKKKNEFEAATSMMQYFMPVMIAVFTASLPAGVGLYWGVSTSYGVVQQLYINKTKDTNTEKEPKVKVIEHK